MDDLLLAGTHQIIKVIVTELSGDEAQEQRRDDKTNALPRTNPTLRWERCEKDEKEMLASESVEEGFEIHKPNYHNQSRQQQPPHKQTRKHELAL